MVWSESVTMNGMAVTPPVTETDIRLWEELLRKIPERKPRPPTFMQILGCSHRENRWSDLLAFFLDPKREHGLDTLFLEALLSCCGATDAPDAQYVSVKREDVTRKDKRMDLVIKCPSFVLGVENKIYAGLQNDLEDYRLHIESLKDERTAYCVLLVLHKPEESFDRRDFRVVTYKEFYQCIQSLLRDRGIQAEAAYAPFLEDIMKTLKILISGEDLMNPETLKFFAEHQEPIGRLQVELDVLKKDLRAKVDGLSKMVRTAKSPSIRRYPWCDPYRAVDVLAFDVVMQEGFVLAIGAEIDPTGWRLQIFDRKYKGISSALKAWLDKCGIKTKRADHSGYERLEYGDHSPLPYDELQAMAARLTEFLRRAGVEVISSEQSDGNA